MRHFTVICDLNVGQRKALLFFSPYFISKYFSFIIVKNGGFVMGFVIFGIYFRLKTIIFNVKTYKPKNLTSVVRYLFFDYWIHFLWIFISMVMVQMV